MADEELEVNEEMFGGGEISISEDVINLDDDVLDLSVDEDDDATDFGLKANSLDD
jgi:hypothetical protein